MTLNTLSPKWEGDFATPIDPTAIHFKIAPAVEECIGCAFLGQRAAVCIKAAAIAKAAGGIDCDYPMPNGMATIYVLEVTDPRQGDLLDTNGEVNG